MTYDAPFSGVSLENALRSVRVVLTLCAGGDATDDECNSVYSLGWSGVVGSTFSGFFSRHAKGTLFTSETSYLLSLSEDEIAAALLAADRHSKHSGRMCWRLYDGPAARARTDGHGTLGNMVATGLFISHFEERDPYLDVVWRAVAVLAGDSGSVEVDVDEISAVLDSTFARMNA